MAVVPLFSAPFAPGKANGGHVEVVELQDADGRKTIGVRICVGSRYVPLPRTQLDDVAKAVDTANKRASCEYTRLLKEMNQRCP